MLKFANIFENKKDLKRTIFRYPNYFYDIKLN